MPISFKDFSQKAGAPMTFDPVDLFNRRPKAKGIKDLYSSQTTILRDWFDQRENQDTVLKLNTGGGKTLVNLLIAESSLLELKKPALYLVPTRQLAQQVLKEASSHGIPAVGYDKPLPPEFLGGKSILVCTYNALFNGKSKFGLRGSPHVVDAGVIILDDAHVSSSVVRDAFTLRVPRTDESYETLTALFRDSFDKLDRLGTFEDILEGKDPGILEVPYWAWRKARGEVREILKDHDDVVMEWPLVRDRLHQCHALVSRKAFSITPTLPFVDLLPTFGEANRRVYASATLTDDSDIVRTFGASMAAVKAPLHSQSVAGVSERMILLPHQMDFEFSISELKPFLDKLASDKRGVLVLSPSNEAAENSSGLGKFAKGTNLAAKRIAELQRGEYFGPLVLANRYDGVDLPDDACRVLLLDGLPRGTSDYELYHAAAFSGGASLSRHIAQKVEQGMGRGARGSGDYCVVLLVGKSLSGWIANNSNFENLTSSTRAQVDLGVDLSRQVESLAVLQDVIERCLDREEEWVAVHAERLGTASPVAPPDLTQLQTAEAERRALKAWNNAQTPKALERLDKAIAAITPIEPDSAGWLSQLAAKIADNEDLEAEAITYQRRAFSLNGNLFRPANPEAYVPKTVVASQAVAIASYVGNYRMRAGMLDDFDSKMSTLNAKASAGQFEQALMGLGSAIGLTSERKDSGGDGPDVLWLLPESIGWVMEAKSRKSPKNPFNKAEHGQLLVAGEWFRGHYPTYERVLVSVHPSSQATDAASAANTSALTLKKLEKLKTDARELMKTLSKSSLEKDELAHYCQQLLDKSSIRSDQLGATYLQPFIAHEEKGIG